MVEDAIGVADFFSCIWSVSRLSFRAPQRGPASWRARNRFGRRFLRLDEHVAEQGRCTEPPFALGAGALEFWVFQKSGLGGRWSFGNLMAEARNAAHPTCSNGTSWPLRLRIC